MVKHKSKKSIFIKALALYFFLTPFDFLPIIEGVSISKILIFIPLAGLLTEIKSFGRIKTSSLYLLLYLGAASATLLWTIDFDSGVTRVVSLILNIGIIILFASRKYSTDEVNYLFKSLALSGWLLAIVCVIFADFTVMLGRLTVVVNGAYQDPNYLCGFFLFSICYYLNEFVVRKKIFGIISVIVFFSIILLTGSRGGTLAALLVVFVFFYKAIASSRRALLVILSSVLIVSVAIYFVWDYLPSEITIRFSQEFNEEDQGSNRLIIWESLWNHFKKSDILTQIFGNGVATVGHYAAFQQVAHNILIEALVEMGILGMIAIFIMYLYYGVKSFSNELLFPPFVGYMSMCMTLSLYSYKPIWNILLLIIIGAFCFSKKHTDTETLILCKA